ncbi:MAG: nucleotidyl transferase AbiEii/AbiGii toxin family protein [Alphaproteobacteria bacterium]|nr:nucleotidyl transferase AbiEii/AbiGii toxin family protein [Alphaproteobacteria bacterium]
MTTTARLGSARIPVIVDVGFGDAITPRPDNVEYPSLLDLPKPRLMVYPRATVVAEKFEAMVSLGLTNSRMKDFHDVAVMACNFEFDGPELTKALAATFHRRKTVLPNKPPAAFTEAFTKRPETVALWRAFVERESIHEDYSDLDTVVGLLREFLLSPASAALGDADFPRRWLPRGPWSA